MPSPPPRLSGATLRIARVFAETPGLSWIVRRVMRNGLGIDRLVELPQSWRGEIPADAKPLAARGPASWPSDALPPPATSSWPRTSSAYAAAYREERATPRAVAERALVELAALADRKPTMNVLAASDRGATLRDADASAQRWLEGKPLGPLDGVPFLVKDEFDVAGLPTRLGSRCESDQPRPRDSTVTARLRAAGAVFVGKTVLTEYGMSPLGGNRSSVMPHNPHDPTRAAGGSSTGSGVGVALGLSPIAAGGDGGGSIRIPSALSGVFGIKPTFGRVSRAGDLFKGTVAHAGPIGASTADLAAFLDAVASTADPDDELTAWAPQPPAGGFGARMGAGVRGARIGVDDGEWDEASPDVARAGQDALAALEKQGARLIPVKSELFRHAARIGYLTIAPESLAAVFEHWRSRRQLMNDDIRVVYAVVEKMGSAEVLDAQRLRSGLRAEAARVLREVDVLALPTTAITAPRYSEKDARTSFSDAGAIDGVCRFAFLANLTGLPALTAPVGVDGAGLPIGLQLVGDAWDEAALLAISAHLERAEIARVVRPPGAVDLLGGSITPA